MKKTQESQTGSAEPDNCRVIIFFPGDIVIEEYRQGALIDDRGTVVVVIPKNKIRFYIDLDDSKRCGHRKMAGMPYDQQISVARQYIDRACKK